MKIIEEIDAYCLGLNINFETNRRSPAPLSDLSELAKLCGHVPEDLRSLLEWRDGECKPPFIFGPGWRLLPCCDIMQRLSMIVGRSMGLQTHDETISLYEEWPESWIPFVDWNESILGILVSDDPTNPNVVLGFDIQSGDVVKWADSLPGFFRKALNQLLLSGRVSVDSLMNSI